MSETNQKPKVKPLFLVSPKAISARDIRRAEQECGICIVECSDPETARFLEPPIDAEMDVQARAALSLMRYITANTSGTSTTFYASTLTKFFVDALLQAPKPASVPRVKGIKK